MRRPYSRILAIDIETSGPSVKKNGILAIGICLGDLFGNVENKQRINVNLDKHHCFDEVCLSQFWNKPGPSQVLRIIQKDTLPPKEAMQKFISIIDEYDKTYKLSIISDNPTFDFYFLSFYMEHYLDRKPLNYKLGTTYRQLIDTCSFARGQKLGKVEKAPTINTQSNILHDHFPENDAEYIYARYVGDYKQYTNRSIHLLRK